MSTPFSPSSAMPRRSPAARALGAASALAASGLTLGLMLVSGLAAHNLERANWYWLPALMIIASTARNDDWDELRETSV